VEDRYGFVLQDVGLGDWVKSFANEFLFPLAVKSGIIDNTTTEARRAITGFKSVHGFVMRYKVGEDLSLAEHFDDSDFTFNICLGTDEFTGAELYFKAKVQRPEGPYEDKLVNYEHSPGVGVIHRGEIAHGVHPLKSGERLNLIVWCKVKENGYF